MKREKKNRGVKTFHRLPVVSLMHMHTASALVFLVLVFLARYHHSSPKLLEHCTSTVQHFVQTGIFYVESRSSSLL